MELRVVEPLVEASTSEHPRIIGGVGGRQAESTLRAYQGTPTLEEESDLMGQQLTLSTQSH